MTNENMTHHNMTLEKQRSHRSAHTPMRFVRICMMRISLVLVSFVLMAALLAALTPPVASWADEGPSGSLDLNTDVLQNSGVPAGTSGDFPIKAELFLPTLTQQSKANENSIAKSVALARKQTFTSASAPIEGPADYRSTRTALFGDDYQPQTVLSTASIGDRTSTAHWMYPALIAAGVCLAILAGVIGNRHANKKTKRQS